LNLRDLADRLERAFEEGIEVPSLYDLHILERRRRAGRAPVDLLDLDLENPRANDKRGKRARVTQRGLLA
jgi:hypothetical protein